MESIIKTNIRLAPIWIRAKLGRQQLVPLYIGSVTLLGLWIIILAINHLPTDWTGLLLFVGMAALAELLSVELFSNSRSRVSVSTIISIAAILAFGPLAGVITQVAAGIMTTVTTTFFQRSQPERRATWLRRAGFNIGMWVIASACAGWMYLLFGGETERLASLTNIFPLFAAVFTDVFINLTLLIGVIALQTGQSPAQIWDRDLKWGVPLILLGGVIGGGILALAFQQFNLLGLVVFFLPILSIGYSFRLYVGKTKVYVNQLETMNQTLDKSNLGLLETLGAVIDAFDVYTYGHSTQVAIYAGALAERMNLSQDEHSAIIKAALVHDIGKVGIAENILNKQGPLTQEELSVLYRHPILGADIVRRMEGMQNLVPLVRHHHERWDGTGYPAGLAGDEIPFGARVIALADALDAMCSDRPYRTSKGIKEITAEISLNSGKQFDPQVVKTCLAILQELGEGFIKNSALSVDAGFPKNKLGSVGQGVRYLKKSMLIDDRNFEKLLADREGEKKILSPAAMKT